MLHESWPLWYAHAQLTTWTSAAMTSVMTTTVLTPIQRMKVMFSRQDLPLLRSLTREHELSPLSRVSMPLPSPLLRLLPRPGLTKSRMNTKDWSTNVVKPCADTTMNGS